jgi:hypothetical protein
VNVTVIDSYLSEATILFNITIFTSRPATISQPSVLCLYQDDPLASLLLVSPLPSFATTPPLTYMLSPLSSPTLPPFLTFDPHTLLLKRTPGQALAPAGTYPIQVHARDQHGQETLTYLTIQVRANRPKVVGGNASCVQGVEYKYLDDEPEGEYRFGLALCFTNGGTSQM